jgi:putative alpha-1,2-mannosidase
VLIPAIVTQAGSAADIQVTPQMTVFGGEGGRNNEGRMQVDGATEKEKARLYTALYHALLYPRIFSEGGRYYSAFDDRVHEGESYTAYSIWDTFRAENSLLTLLAPERVTDVKFAERFTREAHAAAQFKTRSNAVPVYSVPSGRRP